MRLSSREIYYALLLGIFYIPFCRVKNQACSRWNCRTVVH
nr:MAG TPA: hypothetical protein [Caudoviricetes sp.]